MPGAELTPILRQDPRLMMDAVLAGNRISNQRAQLGMQDRQQIANSIMRAIGLYQEEKQREAMGEREDRRLDLAERGVDLQERGLESRLLTEALDREWDKQKIKQAEELFGFEKGRLQAQIDLMGSQKEATEAGAEATRFGTQRGRLTLPGELTRQRQEIEGFEDESALRAEESERRGEAHKSDLATEEARRSLMGAQEDALRAELEQLGKGEAPASTKDFAKFITDRRGELERTYAAAIEDIEDLGDIPADEKRRKRENLMSEYRREREFLDYMEQQGPALLQLMRSTQVSPYDIWTLKRAEWQGLNRESGALSPVGGVAPSPMSPQGGSRLDRLQERLQER